MITMDYYLPAIMERNSLNVTELYSVYKGTNDNFNRVIFHIRIDKGIRNILYTNSNLYPKDSQYIRINNTVYNIQDIMQNPDRIYSLMQQDLLQDSIENNLP